MLALKHGVTIQGIRPELVLAIMIARGVYREMGYDCIITSVTDGVHSLTSLHYTGAAFDLRTHVFRSDDKAATAAARIRNRLGDDFDVLFESAGSPNAHIHVEYQPKRSTTNGNT